MDQDSAQIITELRRLARKGQDISVTAQRGNGLWGAAHRNFGSWRAAIEAAGLDYEKIRRRFSKWDRPRIIRELRRLFRSHQDISTRTLRRTNGPLHAAAIHWFGSFSKAIEAAGIDYARVSHGSPNHWSREAIIKELRRLHRKGEPLHHAAIGRTAPHVVVAAYRFFGTYRKAVEAAGIDYLKVRVRPPRIWTDRLMLAELRKLERAGAGVWRGAVKKANANLMRAMEWHFGSYARGAREAGIDGAALRPPPYRKWSPDRVVAELKQMDRQRKTLQPTRVQATRPSFYHVCRRRFGTYRKALDAAGFDYASIARLMSKPLSAEMVVTRLRALHEAGKDLRYAALGRANPRLLDAARRRFGSYREAMEAAGISYPPKEPLRHWSEPLVLKTLAGLHARGIDLRYSPMKERYMPLFEATKYYFGSYTNAVREAEIDYPEVVRQQRRLKRKRVKAAARAH